jgi:hypothetical protein
MQFAQYVATGFHGRYWQARVHLTVLPASLLPEIRARSCGKQAPSIAYAHCPEPCRDWLLPMRASQCLPYLGMEHN